MPTPTIREVLSGTATAAPVTLTTGAGTTVGDVLVCFHGAQRDNASSMTPPYGTAGTWTLQATGDAGVDTCHVKAWTRPVTVAGAQTVSTLPAGIADNDVILFVLAGADVTNPADGAGGGFDGFANTVHSAREVFPTTANALLLCAAISAAAGSYTPPSGMTEKADVAGSASTFTAASLALTVAGATGWKTFTASPSAVFASATVAIQADTGVVIDSGIDLDPDAGRILASAVPVIVPCRGTPEGAVSAVVGSIAQRVDGGAGTCMYVKESGGSGPTGWIAK